MDRRSKSEPNWEMTVGVQVNVDNFVVAETARMFDNILLMSGGINQWFHFRTPTPVDSQPVIRMNRDTLYSTAVVDLADGARVTLPDTAGRYLSVMLVSDTHHIHRILHDAGTYELTADELGSQHVFVAARMFVDPHDPADVAAVNVLQDELVIDAGSAVPFTHTDYDDESLDATRQDLLRLAEGIADNARMFGTPNEVDPVRHLIGTALGWGGLPEHEAFYVIESDPKPAGHYTMTFNDVPVDAFWSLTIYNRDGFLEEGATGSNSRNSITSAPGPDGSVVLHLAPEPGDWPNHLDVMDGWNYAIRLYRPHREAIDGTWTPPVPVAV